MPYELFLALRYLYTRRRRWTTRITSLAALTGIAAGVAALIVVLALANGFRDEMQDKILTNTAHVTVMRADGQAMAEYRDLILRLRRVDGVVDASATTYDGALLSGPGGSAYAVMRGIDPDSTRIVNDIRRALVEGSAQPLAPETARAEHPPERPNTEGSSYLEGDLPIVIVGSELATRTGLGIGSVGEIITAGGTLSGEGLAPSYRRIRVGGIFRTGLFEYDATWVYMPLSTESDLIGGSGTQGSEASAGSGASAISVEVKDIYDVAGVSSKIQESLGRTYTSIDWQDANRPLFTALALERKMGATVIGLIILIAILNLVTTMVIVVVERRSDIAILSAMGARARGIMLIFLIEGGCIGGLGAIGGVLIGAIACMIGNHYHIVSLPADVYSISNVPLHPRSRDVLFSASVALFLSLLATVYPAWAAARLRPAETLREA
jgi:lipoprotein-releasing system permease protein